MSKRRRLTVRRCQRRFLEFSRKSQVIRKWPSQEIIRLIRLISRRIIAICGSLLSVSFSLLNFLRLQPNSCGLKSGHHPKTHSFTLILTLTLTLTPLNNYTHCLRRITTLPRISDLSFDFWIWENGRRSSSFIFQGKISARENNCLWMKKKNILLNRWLMCVWQRWFSQLHHCCWTMTVDDSRRFDTIFI